MVMVINSDVDARCAEVSSKEVLESNDAESVSKDTASINKELLIRQPDVFKI